MTDRPDPSQPLHLGRQSALPASPEEAVLDYVPNPRAGALYLIRFAVPEFTSLCPVTGQPDFAHLVIDYAPAQTIVESKSLKLFLGSFRNHAGFHEDVTVGIGQRLIEEMAPQWLRIGGYWYPRGGIPIDVFWQSGPPPAGLWLPDQGVPSYRGRGIPRAPHRAHFTRFAKARLSNPPIAQTDAAAPIAKQNAPCDAGSVDQAQTSFGWAETAVHGIVPVIAQQEILTWA